MDAQYWDEKYRSGDRLFSGAPNGVLVTEAVDLPPGQALDVGCGEGADAWWLARRGWQVTAVDVSQVALERAAGNTDTAIAEHVAWVRGDVNATPPPAGSFDLVSVHYFPLARQPDHTGLRGLLDAVAPGGTLLFVSHDPVDLARHHGHRFDDYYQPDDVARLLDENWTVLVNETRPRSATAPPSTHHTNDTVLRARRRD